MVGPTGDKIKLAVMETNGMQDSDHEFTALKPFLSQESRKFVNQQM